MLGIKNSNRGRISTVYPAPNGRNGDWAQSVWALTQPLTQISGASGARDESTPSQVRLKSSRGTKLKNGAGHKSGVGRVHCAVRARGYYFSRSVARLQCRPVVPAILCSSLYVCSTVTRWAGRGMFYVFQVCHRDHVPQRIQF